MDIREFLAGTIQMASPVPGAAPQMSPPAPPVVSSGSSGRRDSRGQAPTFDPRSSNTQRSRGSGGYQGGPAARAAAANAAAAVAATDALAQMDAGPGQAASAAPAASQGGLSARDQALMQTLGTMTMPRMQQMSALVPPRQQMSPRDQAMQRYMSILMADIDPILMDDTSSREAATAARQRALQGLLPVIGQNGIQTMMLPEL